MDALFDLPSEYKDLRASVRSLAENEIAPFAQAVDEDHRFPQEAFDALLADEDNFATIIRGYFYSINDELKKFNRRFTIEESDNIQWFDDVLVTYLNQNQYKLKKKKRKTFQGGVVNKKYKFILPKANPKATPMKL